jgi:hypothetical protein
MKNSTAKFIPFFGFLICSMVVLYFIFHPSEPENARFLGFSYLKLALMGLILIFMLLTGYLTIRAFRDTAWLDTWVARYNRLMVDIPQKEPRQFTLPAPRPLSIRQGWYHQIVLVFLILLIFSPITYSMIFLSPYSDYESHIYWAEEIRHAAVPDVASLVTHAGWQFVVIFVQLVTKSTFPYAGFIVSMLSQVVMALLLFYLLRPALIKQNISLWWGVFIAVGLSLVTPVILLLNRYVRYYFGYMGMITYHNPTIILLRPLALLQLIFTIRGLQDTTSPWKQVILAAIVSVFAAFVKPNYAICILPAVSLIIFYRFIKRIHINWKMLIIGVVLPTLLILTWQFLINYDSGDGTGVIFSPLGVMSILSRFLLLKFLLSILFPLFVLLLYYKHAVKDIRLILTWITFFFGAFFTYFIAESGDRFLHGNFTWSGEITALLLFCSSTVFFIEQLKINRFKANFLSIFWALHALSGIFYYLYVLLTTEYT